MARLPLLLCFLFASHALASPASLLLGNRALRAGGLVDSAGADGVVRLETEEAVALLRRLERVPPFDPPKRSLVLALPSAADAEAVLASGAAMDTTLSHFRVEDGTALVDAFVRGSQARLYCASGMRQRGCRRWAAPETAAEVVAAVEKTEDGRVFVLPLDAEMAADGFVADVVRAADLDATQVVLVAGPSVLQERITVSRRLQTDNGTTPTPAPSTDGDNTFTQEEIDGFQVTLWASVFLILLAFMAVMALCCMDVIPDSLLYAKFQADVSGFKNE